MEARATVPAISRAVQPAAIVVTLLICGLYAAANLWLVTAQWEFDDVGAYLAAAERLRDAEPLYRSAAADVSDLYFYAPWFAFAWVPFTGLPRGMVEGAWSLILVGATAAAVWPMLRPWSWAGLALALLLGGLLYRTAGWGNVQPVVVALLVHALPTRAGPLALGVAASIKAWPMLGVLVYVRRSEWRAAGTAIGVAALLWLPILAYGLDTYPVGQRAPNLYDATFLLAVPGLLRSRKGSPGQSP